MIRTSTVHLKSTSIAQKVSEELDIHRYLSNIPNIQRKCISKKGATLLVLFKANVTVTRYTKLLDAVQTYLEHHLFNQDNDPKHTSWWA